MKDIDGKTDTANSNCVLRSTSGMHRGNNEQRSHFGSRTASGVRRAAMSACKRAAVWAVSCSCACVPYSPHHPRNPAQAVGQNYFSAAHWVPCGDETCDANDMTSMVTTAHGKSAE